YDWAWGYAWGCAVIALSVVIPLIWFPREGMGLVSPIALHEDDPLPWHRNISNLWQAIADALPRFHRSGMLKLLQGGQLRPALIGKDCRWGTLGSPRVSKHRTCGMQMCYSKT